MIPGINPAQAKQMMRKMGIKQDELDARQVIIRLADQEIVFDSPEVSKIAMQGQETFQLSGEYRIQDIETTATIAEEDIEAVMAQTECTREQAVAALEEHGDLAQAIISLGE